MLNYQKIEKLCRDHMVSVCTENVDPSHDILHVDRVVSMTKKLSKKEGANLDISVPAAYLHDAVYISKDDKRRALASKISADKATQLLKSWSYPEELHEAIYHAVHAHSFSAAVKAKSLEAKIVQDSDRLDAMGAIGAIRCFSMSGLLKRPFYNTEDPFCDNRTPDDSKNTLDHFFIKLMKIQENLYTDSAKVEGEKRLKTMKTFLKGLSFEILDLN